MKKLIPKCQNPAAPLFTDTYTVLSGDNLINIAKKFGITVDWLKNNNSIDKDNTIKVDLLLTIPTALVRNYFALQTYYPPWKPRPLNTRAPILNIDMAEIRNRLMWMESGGDPYASSNKNAVGLFLIRLGALNDYNRAHKTNYKLSKLTDPKLNKEIRNWYMDFLGKSKTINNEKSTNSVAVAKLLAAYNYGLGNLGNLLESLKLKGYNIYTSLDWIGELNKETRDYVNFILLNKDVSEYKTQANYLKFKNSQNSRKR